VEHGEEWGPESPCLKEWHSLQLTPIEREVEVKQNRVTIIRVLVETKYSCPVSAKYERLATSLMDTTSVPYSGTSGDFSELQALVQKRNGMAVDILAFDDLCRIARTCSADKARVSSLLDGLDPKFYLVGKVRELLAESTECLVPKNAKWHTNYWGKRVITNQ
jgi:hypothetical protein